MTSEVERAPRDVTVVGAGIVGVATALTLVLDGHRVTLFDPREPGSVTSFGNAGAIVSSNVVPTSVPGLWKRVPAMLADPMGPLTIRWGYLPRIAPWLVRFLAAGTRENATRIARELTPLLTGAVDAHLALLRAVGGRDIVKQVGWLKIYEGEAGFAGSAFEREVLDRCGLRYDVLDADALHQLEPGLSRAYTRAVFFPESAFASTPFALTQNYLRAFLERGGHLVREEARRFELGPAGPTRLVTDRGMHPVDQVVIAAGAWSGRFARALGAPVPLDTERGYHVNLAWDGQDPPLGRPTLVGGPSISLAPMADGFRVTSGVEFGGVDAPPDFTRVRRLVAIARRVLPGLSGEIQREWMGYRPSLPDSKPVIGRSPRFPNAWFAFGHAHVGLTLSAITGRLIADAIAGRAETVPLAPFRADRF